MTDALQDTNLTDGDDNSPAEKPGTFHGSLMETVIRRRPETAYRSSVARGRNELTERYAYPYLAWTWASDGVSWRRVPVLRVSAMACDFPKIPNSRQTFGAAVRGLCAGNEEKEIQRLGLKLGLSQNMSVENATYLWRSLLPLLEQERIGFAWDRLLQTALLWDHPDTETRQRVRRRLLEDFYSRGTSLDGSATTQPDAD